MWTFTLVQLGKHACGRRVSHPQPPSPRTDAQTHRRTHALAPQDCTSLGKYQSLGRLSGGGKQTRKKKKPKQKRSFITLPGWSWFTCLCADVHDTESEPTRLTAFTIPYLVATVCTWRSQTTPITDRGWGGKSTFPDSFVDSVEKQLHDCWDDLTAVGCWLSAPRKTITVYESKTRLCI